MQFSGVIQIKADGAAFTLISGFAVYSGQLLNIFVHIGLAAQQMFGANSGSALEQMSGSGTAIDLYGSTGQINLMYRHLTSSRAG